MLNLNINKRPAEKGIEIEELSQKDIAVIGIAARFPNAHDVDEFWDILYDGIDCISEFPKERRKDVEDYLNLKNSRNNRFYTGGYLKDVDKFDSDFFRIPAKEASLMDPNQRLFLETAWKAIEDAGYSGKRISGTKTGVYVGYSGKSEYQSLITDVEPESIILSEAGNINSIIASRIAYILDLKGPSLLVDTACSSSLVAVHLACQSIRNRECDMAIAGGIKISAIPVELREKFGIESSSGRTRTFDDSSDGTAFGEGAAAILLKPLSKAFKDRDNIYAVIKGSAVNQDGTSVGITAPNVLAQEDLIVSAWRDAKIEPETITYIEAHGTGTVLGDPIEVNAIHKAFRRFTEKSQFCAIGSVKTVIGHLDYAAGIAGLVKAILAVNKGKIPATLNFESPNRKIDFIGSPVYVNDKLTDWKTDGFPRRCGVSSFGLSGTNCHIVLEEAPERETVDGVSGINLFTLSAKKENILYDMLVEYRKHIEGNNLLKMEDICYTVCTGRIHHNHRVVLPAMNMEELVNKLKKIEKCGLKDLKEEGIFYGMHKVVADTKKILEENEIYESDRKQLSEAALDELKKLYASGIQDRESIIRSLYGLYLKGADIEWDALFNTGNYNKVSLPTYRFEKRRRWIDLRNKAVAQNENAGKQVDHPLLDRCLAESIYQDIYMTDFNVDRHWVLNEHRISGKCLVPGTTYLEMVRECCARYFQGNGLEIRDVFFISPLIVEEGETKKVQTILKKEKDYIEFLIAGKQSEDTDDANDWIKYCEGRVYPVEAAVSPTINIGEIKARCKTIEQNQDTGNRGAHLEEFGFGPRWTTLLKGLLVGENEVIAQLSLPEEFHGDLDEYYLHPSLLDIAVNAVTQITGNGMYLPLSYSSFKTYSPLPAAFYSYIRKKETESKSLETISFDIMIADDKGRILAEAQNFVIKKVRHDSINKNSPAVSNEIFNEITWVPVPSENAEKSRLTGNTLVIGDRQQWFNNNIDASFGEVIRVEEGLQFQISDDNLYKCDFSYNAWNMLFEAVKDRNIARIIHLSALECNEEITELEQLEDYMSKGVYSLRGIIKAIVNNKLTQKLEIILVSKNAYRITGREAVINPHNTALLGFGKSIEKEYPNLGCRSIDIDDNTQEDKVISEIRQAFTAYNVAFRDGTRYVEEIRNVDLNALVDKKVDLKPEGVYLITGGTGGLGREIAKHLASKGNINIALVSRSGFQKENNEKLAKTIQEIEQMGSKVFVYKADVSSSDQMHSVISTLKAEFGMIKGIVHAAGVAGDGYIIRKQDELSEAVIRPKTIGTWLLDALTRDQEIDFFIAFSSISSLYGAPGQADYIAANSYLDSFTAYRNGKGRRTLSINWAPWKETGIAADYGLKDDGVFKMISTAEAIHTFEQLLCKETDRIILGRLNYDRIASELGSIDLRFSKKIRDILENRSARNRKLATKSAVRNTALKIKEIDNKDYGNTVKVLAGIWAEALGTDEVDIYVSFNSLGGDSIMATRILKEIDKVFPGIVDIASVFAYPSVVEMSGYIDSKLKTKAEAQTEKIMDGMDSIIEKLQNGSLSVDEALRLL
jgi:polyketide synthase PksN